MHADSIKKQFSLTPGPGLCYTMSHKSANIMKLLVTYRSFHG